MTYQGQRILASYLAGIQANSREVDVDHLWTNLLMYYFPTAADYGIEREPYIGPRSLARGNVSVRTFVNNSMTTVISVENKRPTSARSGNPPDTSWTNAMAQLARYMLSRRRSEQANIDLFGIVGIGKYVKFFQLESGKSELLDLHPNSIFHLDHDSVEIENIIQSMKREIERNR